MRALDIITRTSPKTRILTMAQLGRPREYAEVVARMPGGKVHLSGSGLCDMVDPAGRHLVPKHIDNLTNIVEGYEAELQRVCGQVPQCHYTTASATYQDTRAGLAPDLNHLSAAGHHDFAAVVWPAVAALLNLPAAA